MFYADLHIHSKYSRATSRDADLEHMAIWACKKGVSVLGTGDFTHPEWFSEIKEKLVPAEPGLFRLRDDVQREVDEQTAGALQQTMRFMLEVEISTIYKKGDKTRKVHHLIYAPDLESAERLNRKLSRIGNLKSDGRPILGLDSRDLLEITLESGEGCYLIPAHIWTPWFAVLGSKSGFDAVEECYGDLTEHIFALETGLSSDPPMNWRLSQLDRYTLVSNSDAHSPPKIGREACAFECDMDYFAMRTALETGERYAGTVEFFPEEGKYHLDGHRKCGVRLSPQETRDGGGLCPVCGKNLTVGVMNRVEELADRPEGYEPDEKMQFRSFVPLPEVIAESRGVGEKSKRVQHAYQDLIAKVGSELKLLEQVPVEDIRRAGEPMVAEAIERMRAGRVICDAGYDGEYGTIHLFDESELKQRDSVSLLFELPEPEPPSAARGARVMDGSPEPSVDADRRSPEKNASIAEPGDHPQQSPHQQTCGQQQHESSPYPILEKLDPEQRTAAESADGPLLIIAGPGTGKTRTLTHRIAHLVADHNVSPEHCLAITFSRRAADEMRERLVKLLPKVGEQLPVMTFHALGLLILRDNASRCGLAELFRVASDGERQQLLIDALEMSERQANRALSEISRQKRAANSTVSDPEFVTACQQYQQLMHEHNWLDFDDLIATPLELLRSDESLAQTYRVRWPWIAVDEFQDIDDGQYQLIKQLALPNANLCAIGDPDQAIYGFRGSTGQAFERFGADYPSARSVQLTRNYRSSKSIVRAAVDAIAPSSRVGERTLTALSERAQLVEIQKCPTDRAEAEFVVHTIERLLGGHTFFSIDSERVDDEDGEPLSFSDIAVLYRTDAQAEPLTEAFARSGMPFQKKSHTRLLDNPVIQALVDAIQTFRSDHSHTVTPCPVDELLKQASDKIWEKHPEVADYLETLHPIAARCASADQFLTELAMGTDIDLWDPRAERISLLTLHASKGLEFRVVFLVGCEETVLPLHWGDAHDMDEDEERRLFFVGMTRAGDRLYLSHAQRRMWRGKVRDMNESRFLHDIREELLNRQERQVTRKPKLSDDKQMQLF